MLVYQRVTTIITIIFNNIPHPNLETRHEGWTQPSTTTPQLIVLCLLLTGSLNLSGQALHKLHLLSICWWWQNATEKAWGWHLSMRGRQDILIRAANKTLFFSRFWKGNNCNHTAQLRTTGILLGLLQVQALRFSWYLTHSVSRSWADSEQTLIIGSWHPLKEGILPGFAWLYHCCHCSLLCNIKCFETIIFHLISHICHISSTATASIWFKDPKVISDPCGPWPAICQASEVETNSNSACWAPSGVAGRETQLLSPGDPCTS